MLHQTRMLAALPLLWGLACAPGDGPARQAGDEDGPWRVAVIRYQHETCTFCPGGDTEVEDWTRIREPLEGEEVLQAGTYTVDGEIVESGSYVRGFVSRAEEGRDMELVGITSPYGVFGGSSGSWNSEESFEHFMGLIVDDLREEGPFDAVYLALHGAMAVRNVPRPEAEIARRVREVVGPDASIVGTFDLHGNEDGAFLEWANGAFAVKRFPHYDKYIQGERAAGFVRRILQGEYVPTTATRKPPVITPTVLQWTGQSPAMDIMERARRWEAREVDVYVSVFFGYPWSDVPDVGATVHVMTDDDQEKADRIAEDMAGFIWRVREDFAHGDFPMPDEAVRRTREAIDAGETPVVLADYSDRTGDATWILGELQEQGVERVLYGTLRDEHALDSLWSGGAEPGDAFDLEVGGFTGEAAGRPVRIRGTIRHLGPEFEYERVAVVDYGAGSSLVLTPAVEQVMWPEALEFGGLDVSDYDVIVVKSRAHFRRGFDETGFGETILVVDAPGDWVGTTRLDALDYRFAPIDDLYPFGTVSNPPGGE